jgi:AraC family transcriptional regulator
MSSAIRIFQGRFGRVALLNMSTSLIGHAHHHCHILIKAGGADSAFRVRGQLCPLTQSQAVLVNAWEPHAYEHQSPEGTLILALYIEPSWLAEIQRSLVASAHPRFFTQSVATLSAQSMKNVEGFLVEFWWGDEFSGDRLEQLLFELIIDIIRNNSNWKELSQLLRTVPHAAKDARIRQALAIMQSDQGQSFVAGTLAQEVGLSRAHFYTLFLRDTNVTPLVYANVLRFEAAVQRLSQGKESVSDIAHDLGFSASGHFSRFFREHLGITPRDYRQKVSLFEAVERR